MARPREFEESDVIASAMEVFWRKGYQGTSVADLVEATGLQRGSLYGAFGDKHSLYLTALDAYTSDALAAFARLRSAHDDPVDGVRAFIRMLGEDCKNGTGSERSCMVVGACSELAADDLAARQRVQAFLTDMQGAIGAALAAGQERGSFSADRDPVAVGVFIQSSLQGLNVLAQSKPGDAAIDSVIAELLGTLDFSP